MLSVIVRIVVAAAASFLATSCKDGKTAAPPTPIKPATEYFAINVGGQPVRLQLAVEQPNNMRELSRGLMGRRDLAEDQGMIFVYQRTQRMGFYMRNTPTPLDIGFFTKDGVLREVRQMFPFDETTVASARTDILYAVEMNQGWFARHGVKPTTGTASETTAKIDLKALEEALKARGFKPDDYGFRDETAR